MDSFDSVFNCKLINKLMELVIIFSTNADVLQDSTVSLILFLNYINDLLSAIHNPIHFCGKDFSYSSTIRASKVNSTLCVDLDFC